MISPASFRLTARSVVAPLADSAFSNWLATRLLNHTFVPAMLFAPPAAIYVALFTVPPTEAGGGAEVWGDPSYTRLPIAFTTALDTVPRIANNATVIWPAATADWGTLTAAGLYDAPAGGDLLAFGELLDADGMTAAAVRVQALDIFLIDPGQLTVGIA